MLARHDCKVVTLDTDIPHKWREDLINCRKCVCSLVVFLTSYFLHTLGKNMPQRTSLLLAGVTWKTQLGLSLLLRIPNLTQGSSLVCAQTLNSLYTIVMLKKPTYACGCMLSTSHFLSRHRWIPYRFTTSIHQRKLHPHSAQEDVS